MSSAPSGLDVREYSYGYFYYLAPDAVNHNFTTRGQWQVTKIQVYAAAAAATFVLAGGGNDVVIAAAGCLTLEPNGAWRGAMNLTGEGAVLVVEYWYQATEDGTRPTVTVTP